MNKLVYLFELDSVRNTEKEMLIGQQAMYEEIVVNGNRVVLSFNQITDARAFLCAVENKDQYKHMIELFKKGYVKFSRHEREDKDVPGTKYEICTASQYIQEAIEKNLGKQGDKRKFIFSGLPIKSDETELLNCMYRAIKYSNPSLLEDYMLSDTAQNMDSKEEQERVDYLKRYVSTVLALSVEKLASNPVKGTEKKDFMTFMEMILNMPLEYVEENIRNTAKMAVICLKMVKELFEKQEEEPKKLRDFMNCRSNWHLELLKKEYDSCQPEMAEVIVNLVYNYTIEDSIEGVSKHYKDDDMDSFYKDFSNRLKLFWNEYEYGKQSKKKDEEIHRLRLGEGATTVENYNKYSEWSGFPYWETAVRVIAKKNSILKKSFNKKVQKEVKNKEAENAVAKIYEQDFAKEKRKWNTKLLNTLLLQLLIAAFYIWLMWGYEQVAGGVQSTLTDYLETIGKTLTGNLLIVFDIATYIILLIVSTILAKSVSVFIDIPDIMESVRNIAGTFRDGLRVLRSNKKIAYVRLEKPDSSV